MIRDDIMKKWIGIFIFIFSLSSAAYAMEGEYVVKVTPKANTVTLFSQKMPKQITQEAYLVTSEEELNALQEAFCIEYAEPNYLFELYEQPSDPLTSQQWHLDVIHADNPWTVGVSGSGVRVGVLDTGVYTEHEDLKDVVVEGYDYILETSQMSDTYGHGTLVAGTLSASANNGRGGRGAAPGAKIVPLRVFKGYTTTYDKILQGIDGSIHQFHCDVLNMSFGIQEPAINGEDKRLMEEKIAQAAQAGMLLVAAAGNNIGNTVAYPAGIENVVGVSNINQNLELASSSAYGEAVFVCAPGEGIFGPSISGPNIYTKNNGTSFSAPQVSALAAMAKQIQPDITMEGFQNLLIETSLDLGENGRDDFFGNGLIQMDRALKKLLGGSLYCSPLRRIDDGAALSITNYTAAPQTFQSFFGGYQAGKLEGVKMEEISLAPEETITLYYSGQQEKIRHFLWESDSLIPAAQVQELEK